MTVIHVKAKKEEKKDNYCQKVKLKVYENPLLLILGVLFLIGIVSFISVFMAYFLVFDGSII